MTTIAYYSFGFVYGRLKVPFRPLYFSSITSLTRLVRTFVHISRPGVGTQSVMGFNRVARLLQSFVLSAFFCPELQTLTSSHSGARSPFHALLWSTSSSPFAISRSSFLFNFGHLQSMQRHIMSWIKLFTMLGRLTPASLS